jgi:hypothetical protein
MNVVVPAENAENAVENEDQGKSALTDLFQEVRDKTPAELVELLRGHLDVQTERFVTESELRLHQQNYRQTRHTLQRPHRQGLLPTGLGAQEEDLGGRRACLRQTPS